MKKRWYVVSWEAFNDKELTDAKGDRIWTVSRDPDATGWETDCGYDGYGLTWDEATELASAANSIHEIHEERLACLKRASKT
jgi:hypothetical protein